MTKITTTVNRLIPQSRILISQNFLRLSFLLSLVVGVSFQAPAYADVDTTSDDLKPKNNKVSVNTPTTDTTDENNAPVLNRSVKLELPKTTDKKLTDKDKAKDSPEPKESKSHKQKRTAIDSMSSDDTKPGYNASVDPVLHYQKAKDLANDKKYNEALKEINKALIDNPQYYEADYLGALIYQCQGRKQEAVAKYRRLLMKKPNYLQARIGLGMALKDLGQDKAAEQEYKKAIETSFNSCEAHYNLSNLLIKDNRLKEAIAELKICEKLSPTNAAVHNNLGVIFLHENYIEEAEKEFRQATNLAPANKTFLHNLESVHSADKKKVLPDALG